MSCIFCRIIAGQAPAEVLYRDDRTIAFRDIHPVAPVHVLIVPIQHFDSLNSLSEEDEALAGHLLVVARRLAEELGVARSGYRLVINTGSEGGQTVFHLHLHLLAGRRMPFAGD
ncbi:MAG: histidine triad nucleotide-binding protein [Anaerolineales bacterium]|nr:histidine triad nucleotide-binding protein [Anaerolineales bacterium]MCX7608376.1 histidine triad nucleotide-binding protein [Anaerolineales bacterium]MDW8227764.1 histidine triad nucleotide-binding protein [Anaerolineales bacterium]